MQHRDCRLRDVGIQAFTTTTWMVAKRAPVRSGARSRCRREVVVAWDRIACIRFQRPRPPAGSDGKKGGVDRCLGRSRGGLTTKLHALVDKQRRPILVKLTAGQASDIASAEDLIGHLAPGSMLLADKGHDVNALRAAVAERKAWANIPPKANRKDPICFLKHLYKARNLVERFFNKIKQFRRVATRFEKTAENFLAVVKLAAIRIWLRRNESTA